MIGRKIQSETYWQDEFSISKQDIDGLVNLFLDEGRPLTSSELAYALVADYCQRDQSLVRRNLAGGTVYRPNGTFSVGETLVFPHLSFARGTVSTVRDGNNPEYGDFQVITVQLDKEERQFASSLMIEHRLNIPDDVSVETMFVPQVQELYDRYGELVTAKLESKLEQSDKFVFFRDQWLAASMMVEVHIGHLNLAEAVLDMHGTPLPTEKLLPDLDLAQEAPQPIRLFSLNHVIAQDDRFDDVGGNGQIVWSLYRWEPQAIKSVPNWVHYDPIPYDRTKLDVFHLQLEREIDDEASAIVAPPSAAEKRSLTLTLGYHHRRLGSLPLSERTKYFFPSGHPDQHTRVTFVDLAQGSEFPGWVMHADKLVYGLGAWYEEKELPVGAYIELAKTDDPNRVAIDIQSRRMRREWMYTLFKNDENDLRFQMQKAPVTCEYDEWFLMSIDPQIAEELWQAEQGRNRSLDEVIHHAFLELAKLSPHGTVHAKTLYNAVNVLKRCPPGRIFATLFKLPHFVSVDEGSWLFSESVC
ncbi:MAG: hypothetical protein JXA89_06230 [Anaerolineae bacterium]|nr:hypothetical protein [Anaerolineae bacterium]